MLFRVGKYLLWLSMTGLTTFDDNERKIHKLIILRIEYVTS